MAVHRRAIDEAIMSAFTFQMLCPKIAFSSRARVVLAARKLEDSWDPSKVACSDLRQRSCLSRRVAYYLLARRGWPLPTSHPRPSPPVRPSLENSFTSKVVSIGALTEQLRVGLPSSKRPSASSPSPGARAPLHVASNAELALLSQTAFDRETIHIAQSEGRRILDQIRSYGKLNGRMSLQLTHNHSRRCPP